MKDPEIPLDVAVYLATKDLAAQLDAIVAYAQSLEDARGIVRVGFSTEWVTDPNNLIAQPVQRLLVKVFLSRLTIEAFNTFERLASNQLPIRVTNGPNGRPVTQTRTFPL